jgi:hypothetical protein
MTRREEAQTMCETNTGGNQSKSEKDNSAIMYWNLTIKKVSEQ